MRKQLTITAISLSAIIGIVIIVKIFSEIPLFDVIDLFKHATAKAIIGFIVVSIAIMFLHAWRWNIILRTVGEKIPFHKIFAYKIVGYGISFITPIAKVGGEPLRAMLLQRHKVPFRKGFATVIMDKLIDLVVTGILLVMGIFIAITSIALPKDALLLLIAISITIIGLIVWFYLRVVSNRNIMLDAFHFFHLHKITKLNKYRENIIEMDHQLVRFHKDHSKAFNKSVLISVGAWILMFAEFKTALMIFGINSISFSGLFLIITMMGFTYLFPIPLALGVLEAGQLSTFALLRLNPAASIGLSMTIRARDLVWTVIGIIILSFYGFSLKSAYSKTVEQKGLRMPKEDMVVKKTKKRSISKKKKPKQSK